MARYGQARSAKLEEATGFTLLELLVVVAILALLLVVVPQAMAGLPGIRLRAAAAGLCDTLRQARLAAISTGRPTEVAIDTRQHIYAASGRETVVLPSVVSTIDFARDAPAAQDTDIRFRFFPDGSATGGIVTLRHDQRRVYILVEWLTGRVRVDD